MKFESFKDMQKWHFGVRSKYIVNPMLVEELLVHRVMKSASDYRLKVIPSWLGELHHYRNYVTSKGMKTRFKTLPHVEDMNIVSTFVRPLCRTAEQVCSRINVTCEFVYL